MSRGVDLLDVRRAGRRWDRTWLGAGGRGADGAKVEEWKKAGMRIHLAKAGLLTAWGAEAGGRLTARRWYWKRSSSSAGPAVR